WHIAPLSSPSPEGLSYGQKKPAQGDAGGKE
ncbi:hypothetical protein EC960939_1568, partial [Escherichia coli 96.0939]